MGENKEACCENSSDNASDPLIEACRTSTHESFVIEYQKYLSEENEEKGRALCYPYKVKKTHREYGEDFLEYEIGSVEYEEDFEVKKVDPDHEEAELACFDSAH